MKEKNDESKSETAQRQSASRAFLLYPDNVKETYRYMNLSSDDVYCNPFFFPRNKSSARKHNRYLFRSSLFRALVCDSKSIKCIYLPRSARTFCTIAVLIYVRRFAVRINTWQRRREPESWSLGNAAKQCNCETVRTRIILLIRIA